MKLNKKIILGFIPLSLVEISRIAEIMESSAVEVVNIFGGIKPYAKLRRVIVAQNMEAN